MEAIISLVLFVVGCAISYVAVSGASVLLVMASGLLDRAGFRRYVLPGPG